MKVSDNRLFSLAERHRSRVILAASVAAVALVLSSATAAQASSLPAQPAVLGVDSGTCGGDLPAAVDAADALTVGDATAGYFFTCTGSQIVVEPAVAGEAVAMIAYNSETSESVDLTGLSDAERATAVQEIEPEESVTSGSMGTMDLASWSRTINHSYRETLSWITTYGYGGGGETEPFVSEFTNRVILKLGQAQVQYAEYSWTNLDDRLMAPNMSVDVMENQGYSPPTYTDMGATLGSERDMPGGTYVFRSSHTEQGTLTPTVNGRSYHITVGANSFTDLDANHNFFVGETGAGHRWVCYGVCEFPNGEEAPILTR